jgi:hypothetical protein
MIALIFVPIFAVGAAIAVFGYVMWRGLRPRPRRHARCTSDG